MPVTIRKAGEYLSATEVVKYLHDAGVTYGLPHLAKINHTNKLMRMQKAGTLPEPDFTHAFRDGWHKDTIDHWVSLERRRSVARVLEATRTLGDEELNQLYAELGKQIGKAPTVKRRVQTAKTSQN